MQPGNFWIIDGFINTGWYLPQGFPTSPMIANLIAYGLDMQHLGQCDKSNITRTRWIDDIVFSGETVALKSNMRSLMGAIAHHGFKLNYRETAYKVRANHPIVTGLDVRGEHHMYRLP